VRWSVIFIRKQDLNSAQHVELARVFGTPIRKNIYLPSVDEFPEIEVIAHNEHTRSGGTDNWHVDVSWQHEPPKATVLHIKQVPAGGGGDTIWASATAAYDLLDPDLARYFEKLTAVNTFLASPKKAALSDLLTGYAAGRQETVEEGQARVRDASIKFPPIEVPVVKTHPENGRKLIFVNEAHTSHLLGVSKTASQSLLNYLYDLMKTPIIRSGSRSGAKSVSQEQVQAARSMGATGLQLVRYVVFPAALPEILVGLRIGMGVGWTTLVAAEMVAADAGLGKMVFNASNFLRTDVVILGILVIGLVAYAFETFLRLFEAWAVPWKGRVWLLLACGWLRTGRLKRACRYHWRGRDPGLAHRQAAENSARRHFPLHHQDCARTKPKLREIPVLSV